MVSQALDEAVPSLSIVTPSFNQGPFIKEAIESVAIQRSADVEHLILDGGSVDETLHILKQCAKTPARKHVRWSSRPDGGQSEALNRGFREARGELIGWLNSDDRYRPGCFEYVRRTFADNPNVDVLYGDYTVINETGQVLKIRREIDFNPFILKYHRVLYIPTAATFFRRRIFTEGNWLNEELHYAMDFDFFVRIATAGYRFKHIPSVLADIRLHPLSKSCAKTDLMLQERESLMRVHSQISTKLQFPALREAAFAGAQVMAATMRYTEKMVRGHYFRQSHNHLPDIKRNLANS